MIRKEKDKQKFYAAHEADFIINDAAKRQLDKLGAPKQLPKRKEVVAEIQSLVSQKNDCYNDYRERSDRLHELMTMQRNYQMAMQPQQPKHRRKSMSRSGKKQNAARNGGICGRSIRLIFTCFGQ